MQEKKSKNSTRREEDRMMEVLVDRLYPIGVNEETAFIISMMMGTSKATEELIKWLDENPGVNEKTVIEKVMTMARTE